MRIGIDATTWWNGRGFGRFTRDLLQAMFHQDGHEFVLFVDHPPCKEMLVPNVRVVQVKTSAPVTVTAVSDGNRSLRDVLRFRSSVRRERLDLMYFPAVYSWFPIGPGIPNVVTFHDAIAERFPALVMPNWRGRFFWNAKTWLAKRTASHIVTVSNAAADEIGTYLGVPPELMSVIYEAAGPEFAPVVAPERREALRRQFGVGNDRRYILYVGGIAPHKNLDNLVRAFSLACGDRAFADLDLVFTGDPKGSGFLSSHASLLRCINEHPGAKNRIHFTGFVSDADLPTLYSDALVTAMPAFSEGFGLPALEGLACGTPVIATADGAVAEIADNAGLYFDPYDIESIATTIRRIAGDAQLLETLRARCVPRAAEFDWDRSARSLLDVFNGVRAQV